MKTNDKEYFLVGLAILAAQRVEFALYGLASHVNDSDFVKQDRRLLNLTPESFLRGDLEKLKITLGQLVGIFGDAFLIRTSGLIEFYQDRNLIAHDYYRLFLSKVENGPYRENGKEFLLEFLKRSQYWEAVLRGLLNLMRQGTAVKEGRESEINFSPSDLEDIRAFGEHAARHLAEKSAASTS